MYIQLPTSKQIYIYTCIYIYTKKWIPINTFTSTLLTYFELNITSIFLGRKKINNQKEIVFVILEEAIYEA